MRQFSHHIFLHVGHCYSGGLRNPPICLPHLAQKPFYHPLVIRLCLRSSARVTAMGTTHAAASIARIEAGIPGPTRSSR
jgi:hypothetical protein